MAQSRARRGIWVRLGSAAVLIPIVLLAIYLGEEWFTGFVTLCAALAVAEWVYLATGRDRLWPVGAALIAILAVAIATDAGGPALGVVTVIFATALLTLVYEAARLPAIAWLWPALPYCGLAVVALFWLRHEAPDGALVVVWFFLIVWGTDTGGLIAGKTIGGPRLAPVLSPKKTWAGLAGAMALAGIGGGIIAALLGWNGLGAGLVAAVLAVVAQGGDLVESALKRRFAVKDISNLIPGHGGLLDRIDGLLAAAPALAILHWITAGAWAW